VCVFVRVRAYKCACMRLCVCVFAVDAYGWRGWVVCVRGVMGVGVGSCVMIRRLGDYGVRMGLGVGWGHG